MCLAQGLTQDVESFRNHKPKETRDERRTWKLLNNTRKIKFERMQGRPLHEVDLNDDIDERQTE